MRQLRGDSALPAAAERPRIAREILVPPYQAGQKARQAVNAGTLWHGRSALALPTATRAVAATDCLCRHLCQLEPDPPQTAFTHEPMCAPVRRRSGGGRTEVLGSVSFHGGHHVR
ncbi:hypothetical protein [Nonomuraea jabiensis]|uniref:hypothetical protein n=1 Tax=Nonomuraea jabiensis TaxID=882448 RepID=UPI003D73827C